MCNCKCRGAISSQGPRGPIGATGPAGPAGPTGYKSVNNTVFVDQAFGSDSTGLRERLDLPFQTITAAQTAALSGDTIHVFPGTYTDYNLGKYGVSFYFSLGANITVSTGNRDLFLINDENDVNVYGYGRFQTTGCIVLVTRSSGANVANIEGVSAVVENGSTNGSCLIEVNSPTGACEINMEFSDRMYSNHSNFINTATTATINVTCPDIKSAGAVSQYAGANSSVITINGSVRQVGSPYVYAYTYDGLFRVHDTQQLILNADCTAVGPGILYGTVYVKNNITVASSTAAINHSGVLLFVQGRIKNTTSNANAHVITLTAAGAKTIFNGGILVATHASALSIQAPDVRNIIIYNAVANRNVTAGFITNIITGTTLYVDSDVE